MRYQFGLCLLPKRALVGGSNPMLVTSVLCIFLFLILTLMDGFGPEEDKQAAHPPSEQTTNKQQQTIRCRVSYEVRSSRSGQLRHLTGASP